MGLDIYFYKRKNDADTQRRFEEMKNVSKEYDSVYAEIGAAYTNRAASTDTAEEEKLTEEITDLREKLRGLEKKYNELNPRSEVGYFRKVNFLLGDGGFNDVENCGYREISKCEVEDMIDKCRRVLEDHSLADELLPVQEGCFFGNYEYDEWYFDDVRNVLDTFSMFLETIDWDTEVLEIHIWW